MYQALKNNTVQYILDYEPTPEQLNDLGCDSYEPYETPEPTAEQLKAQPTQALISTPDLLEIKINPEDFSDQEIGDIIVARCFGGNPHGQTALLAKTSAYLLSVVSGEPNETLLEEIQAKQAQINEVRKKFGLSEI